MKIFLFIIIIIISFFTDKVLVILVCHNFILS